MDSSLLDIRTIVLYNDCNKMDNLMPYTCQSSTKYLVSLSLPLPRNGIRSSQKLKIFHSILFWENMDLTCSRSKRNYSYSQFRNQPFEGMVVDKYSTSKSRLNTYINLSTNDKNRTRGGVELDSNCSRTPVKRVFLMMD